MRSRRQVFLVFAVMCALMLLSVGWVYGAEETRIMIAVTGDTQGEINPCG